jgi:two-component sensor histidine kinase
MSYEIHGQDWKLILSDNGIGKGRQYCRDNRRLGTAIIEALVRQSGARMDAASNPGGTTVSATRATFTSHIPHAA